MLAEIISVITNDGRHSSASRVVATCRSSFWDSGCFRGSEPAAISGIKNEPKQFMHFTSPLREITYHMGSQCYLPPGRGDFPAFTPAEAGTSWYLI